MLPDESSSDSDLLERMRANDARAFEVIFHRYYDTLCRSVASYLGDRDAVEDVVQSVLVRLWQNRHTSAIPTNLGSYLFAAVRRRAVDEIRRDDVRRLAAPLLSLEIGASTPPSGETFEADALRNRFARAIAGLPPRTREAFILSRRDGLSYDEIALRMGISIKTVGVHVGNSLAALRKVIGD